MIAPLSHGGAIVYLLTKGIAMEQQQSSGSYEAGYAAGQRWAEEQAAPGEVERLRTWWDRLDELDRRILTGTGDPLGPGRKVLWAINGLDSESPDREQVEQFFRDVLRLGHGSGDIEGVEAGADEPETVRGVIDGALAES